MEDRTGSVSRLLRAWGHGDLQERDELVPVAYRELRRRAGAYLRRERSDHTLQPTALVHEAYLRLTAQDRVAWQNRAHFFAIAAQMMRRVLIDHAREHLAAKRPGANLKVLLDDGIGAAQPRACELIMGRLLDAGSIASMILVCRSPGVFAGDRLEQRVRVERVARVRLVSQSALQVHPEAGPAATSSPATLNSSYDVADEGRLDCIWDPMIPFAGARLQQRIDIRIAGHGDLFWSDALMSGRAGRGEAWRFERLDHELRASVGGSLQYLERYVLAPQSRAVSHAWSVHRANYLGTTIVHSEAVTTARAEETQQRLGAIEALRAGVDCLAPHLLVARLLAERGPQFASARAVLGDVFDRPALRRS
jgi:RNA polymerase sigma factor (TIGR02999 family)